VSCCDIDDHAILLLLLSITYILAIATAAVTGGVQMLVNSMVWYRFQSIGVLLFIIPAIVTITVIQRYGIKMINKSKAYDLYELEHAAFIAVLAFYTMGLLILTAFGIHTAYVYMISCIFMITSRTIVSFIYNIRREPMKFLITYWMTGILFPTVLQSQLTISAIDFVVPLFGRLGDRLPVDIAAGVVYAGLFTICTTYIFSFLQLLDRKSIPSLYIILTIIYVVTLSVTPLINPYSSERSKRIFSQHVTRKFYRNMSGKQELLKEDSNVWIQGMDWRGIHDIKKLRMPASVFQPSLKGTDKDIEYSLRDAGTVQCEGIYCNLPWVCQSQAL
jgi:hypothetical protein